MTPVKDIAAHLRRAATLIRTDGWTAGEMADADGYCVLGAIIATDESVAENWVEKWNCGELDDAMAGWADIDAVVALRSYLCQHSDAVSRYGYGREYDDQFEANALPSERLTGWNDLELAAMLYPRQLAAEALDGAAAWIEHMSGAELYGVFA